MADKAAWLDGILQLGNTVATAVTTYFLAVRHGRKQAERAQDAAAPRLSSPSPGELDAGMSAVFRTLGLELQELRDQNRDFARQLRETEGRWRKEREEHERQLAGLHAQVQERDQRIAQLLAQIEVLSKASVEA